MNEEYFVPMEPPSVLQFNTPIMKTWENAQVALEMWHLVDRLKPDQKVIVNIWHNGRQTRETGTVIRQTVHDPDSMTWMSQTQVCPSVWITNFDGESLLVNHSIYGSLNIRGSVLSCPINERMDTFFLILD